MNQGVILVLVIVLFFGIMYLYAYGTTGYREHQLEKRRRMKIRQAKLKEEQLKKNSEERLREISMKYEAANERSKQIKRELEELRIWNQEKKHKDARQED